MVWPVGTIPSRAMATAAMSSVPAASRVSPAYRPAGPPSPSPAHTGATGFSAHQHWWDMPRFLADANFPVGRLLNALQHGVAIGTQPASERMQDECQTIGFGIVPVGVPSVVLPVYISSNAPVTVCIEAHWSSALTDKLDCSSAACASYLTSATSYAQMTCQWL